MKPPASEEEPAAPTWWTWESEGDLTNSGSNDLTELEIASGLSAGLDTIEIFIEDFSTDTNNQGARLILSDGGGYETSGYQCAASIPGGAQFFEGGFHACADVNCDAADTTNFMFRLTRWDASEHLWYCEGWRDREGGTTNGVSFGRIILDSALTGLKITTTNETATFDSGTVNVRYQNGQYTYGSQIDLTNGGNDDTKTWELASGLSGVRLIEVIIFNQSFDADNTVPIIQLGDSGGLETTGYLSSSTINATSASYTDGFYSGVVANQDAGDSHHGKFTIIRPLSSEHYWMYGHVGFEPTASYAKRAAGHKELSAELTTVQLLSNNSGSANFDGGEARIRYM